MIHPSYMYRLTPEEIAIRHEQERARADQACGSCANRSPFKINGELARECKFKRRTYGFRCDLYQREVA